MAQHLRSLVSSMFIQHFVQANINQNIKAPHNWPFVRGIHQWPPPGHHWARLFWSWILLSSITDADIRAPNEIYIPGIFQGYSLPISFHPAQLAWQPANINSSPAGENGGYFTDDIFQSIFVNKKISILIFSFSPKGQIWQCICRDWQQPWSPLTIMDK